MATQKKPQPRNLPADARLASVLSTRPTALADRFKRDGDWLIFTSRRGVNLRLDLDPEIGVLYKAMDLDMAHMDADDLKAILGLVVGLAGEDAKHLSFKEVLPVFERWSWEMAVTMLGVDLPESEDSETA